MASLSQQVAEMKTLMNQCETELTSLMNGRKASGPRTRSSLQKIKGLAHSMRSGVMGYTKDLPTKTRGKKEAVVEEIPQPLVLERQNTEEPVKKARNPRKKPIKEAVE
jgi:hypothetical protein